MNQRDQRPAMTAERSSFSNAPTTFGILDEWAEGLAAAAAQAERGALAHRSFAEAYWEAREAAA